eukprot:GHVS01045796.1.p2 GENE.GHVS01045796.1~~GHVS01045796.1.p2  ORF type:complete len:112 (+),score=3.54 GHVS01045796.1:34-336(+)
MPPVIQIFVAGGQLNRGQVTRDQVIKPVESSRIVHTTSRVNTIQGGSARYIYSSQDKPPPPRFKLDTYPVVYPFGNRGEYGIPMDAARFREQHRRRAGSS